MVDFMKVDKIREIARTNIEHLFNTTINSIIEKAFEFEDKYQDEYLISTHFAFREILNETRGTGRGITGLSELWYFLYIKKFLERFLKIEFETIKTDNSQTANYKGNKLILSSDLSIQTNFKLKISNNSSTRPDIFIVIKKNNMEIIPIAIFEIKLYQESAHKIEEVVNRFIEIKDVLNTDKSDLPFFIFLYLQHSQYEFKFDKEKQDRYNIQLERFKNLFGKDMLMINRISKWDEEGYENEIEGSIYQIMDKIVASIN